MKYYLIAGEKSGDMHAGALVKEIRQLDPDAELRGVGGAKLKEAGVSLLFHFEALAIMGFWEVILNIWTIRRRLTACQNDISAFKPDVVILIDSGGFNLRVAAFTQKLGIKTIYFIPPKVWAWGAWRAAKLRQRIDQLFVSLPFEEPLLRNLGLKAKYLGSPVVTQLLDSSITPANDKGHVALLPGSRKQEVRSNLRLMLKVAKSYPHEKFVVCGVNELPQRVYGIHNFPANVEMTYDLTYQVLAQAKAAIVASGTATLEACLLSVPQVVMYKTHWVNYLVGRMLIRVRFISLVNLIADTQVVKELIQRHANTTQVAAELQKLLFDDVYVKRIQQGYQGIRLKLGSENAYRNLALRVCGKAN